MGNLIKAENRKIVTTKSWWALMIPAAVFAYFFALGWGAATNDIDDFLGTSDAEDFAKLLGVEVGQLPVGALALGHGINIGIFFPVMFGVFALAGEYKKKTITTTFLTAPNRGSALTAKMITYIGWATLYGVVIVGFASLGMITSVDSGKQPGSGLYLAMAGAGILATILATLFGIGVGAVFKSVTGAVVTLAIWMLVVENVLVVLGPFLFDSFGIGGVLPNGSLNGIVGAIGAEAWGAAGVSVPDAMDEELQWAMQLAAGAPGASSWWSSAVIFLVYTGLFFGGAWAANQSRDIT
jgi:ABC-2 type transport system permease protein